MADAPVTISVRPNGPLRVEGPIKLINTDGNRSHWEARDLTLSLRSLGQQAVL
jgi:hypothetical protein